MLSVDHNRFDIRCNPLPVQIATDSGNFLLGIFPKVLDISKCLWK